MSLPKPARKTIRWAAIWAILLGVPILSFAILGEERFLAALAWARTPRAVAALCWAMLASDVLLPIPSSFVAVAMGGAAGTLAGAFLNWTAITLGHILGFALARRWGAPLAERFIGEKGLARAGRTWGDGAMTALIITRPIPILAEAVAMYAGLTGLGWRRFAAVAALANIPHSLVYAWAGANMKDAGSLNMLILGGVGLPALAYAVFALTRRRSPS